MGWLFAVSLGLQERNGRAVWRALGPLAVGHGLAIAAAVSATATLGHRRCRSRGCVGSPRVRSWRSGRSICGAIVTRAAAECR